MPSVYNTALKAYNTLIAGEILRDYTHASDVFVTGGSYLGSPKYKWFFHVFFDSVANIGNIGLAVKTAKLPGYTVLADTLNQYNRPRIVQKKIKYTPVDLTFHDDYAGVSRALWSKYSQYYFDDSSRAKAAGLNKRDIYGTSANLGWGYTGPTTPFINSIKIYSLFGLQKEKQWHSYQLINPIITKWDHDGHSYSEDTGIMENKMTVEYESVVYGSGSGKPDGYDLENK